MVKEEEPMTPAQMAINGLKVSLHKVYQTLFPKFPESHYILISFSCPTLDPFCNESSLGTWICSIHWV